MKVVSSARLKSKIKDRLVTCYPTVDFYFFQNMKEAYEQLLDAEILITYGEDLTASIIRDAKVLKWIMVISAGIDQLPFQEIKEKGILVTNARGIHKVPMAEYTMGMILQVSRQAKRLMENQSNHIWDRRVPMTEIYGKTLGIVGTGAIGAQIATYANVFGMNVIGYNRSGRTLSEFKEIVSIEKLLASSDFVVSVLPGTNETIGFFDKIKFQQMKRSAVFINIGRGKTVIENDLIEILNKGIIFHAILDVFENEPLPTEHPLWDMDNVTITPHLSGISSQYQSRAIRIFEYNLKIFIEGGHEYENMIDLDKGY